MVNRRGVAQAGTGAVYLLFPVLFFCFVLYHTLFVTITRAKYYDPVREERNKKRAEQLAEKRLGQRQRQGQRQERGVEGQHEACDALSAVATNALQDIDFDSRQAVAENEDLLDLRCTGKRLMTEKGVTIPATAVKGKKKVQPLLDYPEAVLVDDAAGAGGAPMQPVKPPTANVWQCSSNDKYHVGASFTSVNDTLYTRHDTPLKMNELVVSLGMSTVDLDSEIPVDSLAGPPGTAVRPRRADDSESGIGTMPNVIKAEEVSGVDYVGEEEVHDVEAEEEEPEPGWEALEDGDDYVNRYGILFEDYKGPRLAAVFKSLDVFRMLVAGTSISVLTGSEDAFHLWLQAALVFAVQVVQFILECLFRPEADWKANVTTINGMATEIVPLALCFVPIHLLGDCDQMGLGTQLLVLCVAMLSIVQQLLGLLWETAPMWMDLFSTVCYYSKQMLLLVRNYATTGRCCAEMSDTAVDTSGERRLTRHEKEAEESAKAARMAARMAWAAVAIAAAKAEKTVDDYDHDMSTGHDNTNRSEGKGLSASAYAHTFFRAGTVQNILAIDSNGVHSYEPKLLFGKNTPGTPDAAAPEAALLAVNTELEDAAAMIQARVRGTKVRKERQGGGKGRGEGGGEGTRGTEVAVEAAAEAAADATAESRAVEATAMPASVALRVVCTEL
jgi:hypothetical protein